MKTQYYLFTTFTPYYGKRQCVVSILGDPPLAAGEGELVLAHWPQGDLDPRFVTTTMTAFSWPYELKLLVEL